MNSLKLLLKEEIPDLRCIGKKLMAHTWSEGEDSRRVLAFLNIMKALDIEPETVGLCIKIMFVNYVRNCKFVLGSNIAQLNFMRESLLVLFGKNLDESYLHAFVYVRQLAITLRKAYTMQSKEDFQSVYNWQFICSLRLWSEFIAKYANESKLINSLIHPVVQVIIGAIKLRGGDRWIPLRFYCISMLHTLSGVPVLSHPDEAITDQLKDGTLPLVGNCLQPSNRLFVPSLSLLLDVFQMVNFNRRATNASKAPFDLRLFLHFSPSHRRESACLDSVIMWLFDLLTEAVALQANSVSFPEYVLPLMSELKRFTQVCRIATFTRQMKTLYTRVREHSDWITLCRKRVRNLNDANQLTNVESSFTFFDTATNKLLPFWQFYIQHKHLRFSELNRLAEANKKDPIPSDSSSVKDGSNVDRKDTAAAAVDVDDDEEEEDDDDSDASYDYDDGVEVTHVSKSKRSSQSDDDGDDDSDFDLEQALKEQDDLDVEQSNDADEVTDFELEDDDEDDLASVYEPSDDEGDVEMVQQRKETNKAKTKKNTKKSSDESMTQIRKTNKVRKFLKKAAKVDQKKKGCKKKKMR